MSGQSFCDYTSTVKKKGSVRFQTEIMLEKIHDTQTMITKTYNNSVIEIDAGKKKRKNHIQSY